MRLILPIFISMEQNSDLVPRVGIFFYLVAAALMVLFIGSDLAKDPQFDLFFLSLAAAFVGYLMRRRAAKPAASGRFGMLQKARARRKERLEKKKQKQQQKKS